MHDYRIPAVDLLNALVRRVGAAAAWLNLLLIAIILAQVVLRYGFHHGLVALEELMRYCFALAFMPGLAYALANDSHIRIDILHGVLPRRARHWIEVLGLLLLLLPFLWVVLDHSLVWVANAYRLDEGSTSPQGLPHRWIIKGLIPLGFGLLGLAALARLLGETLLLLQRSPGAAATGPHRVSALRRFFSPQPRTLGQGD